MPELLSRIASRISEAENEDEDALQSMKRRLAALKEQTEAARDDVAHKNANEDETARGGKVGSTFASVEAAISKLARQTEEGDTRTAQSDAGNARDRMWREPEAEALIAHMEEEGLAEPLVKDDLLLGDIEPAKADERTSYIYLQPDAQELSQKWFEDRFNALAEHFERTPNGSYNSDAGMAPLLEKFNSMEARFSQLLGYPTEDGEPAQGGGLHDIELCIAEIAAQLEVTTTELKRIETIERQIAEISTALATGGDRTGRDAGAMFDVAALADQVADRMAARPMAFAGSAGGRIEPGDAAGIGELSAVMKEFMRERRSDGEHTNAVLDTMQQTIIRVLDRIDSLEASGARPASIGQHATATQPATAAAPPEYAAASASAATIDGKNAAGMYDGFDAEPGAGNYADMATHGLEEDTERRPSYAKETRSAEEQSLNRLERAVGQLNDTAPTTPQKPGQKRSAQNRGSEPSQPVTSRIRADFIAQARQAAAHASSADGAPDGRLPRQHQEPAFEETDADALEHERARFAAAARKAAQKAGRRVSNDDMVDDDIENVDEGFSIGKIGASISGRLRPTGKSSNRAAPSNRARLLVAALAIMAIGLGATKFMMSRTAETVPAQTSKMQQGSYLSDSQTATKVSDVQTQQREAVAVNDAVSGLPTATASYNPAELGLVQQTAVEPGVAAETNGEPLSGGAGSVARKALPSALVGPLSLRLAAANGDASAEFQVATRFADGKGVEQNFDEAIKWYTRSAARGFALSQYRLGTFYERGLGVDKDAQRARVWYERAASQDNIKSMHNLAVLAASPTGGKPDYTTAARWFTEAAERGLADSQFNLAILYQNGLGVPQDDGMAYKWFNLAAVSGDKEAMKRMTTLASALGKKTVAALDKDVIGWVRKPVSKMANDPHYAGQAWQRQS